VVDTSKAGCGALAVTVDGPSKVYLDCQELQSSTTADGTSGTAGTSGTSTGASAGGIYALSYQPSSAGEYTVSVKYAGDHHITGSPFHVYVTGT